MKTLKLIIPIAGLLLASTTIHSQTVYDVTKITGSDLNGTARFVGMGGAMGALGGDISTMGTNPAGIGIYRSNDLNISFGFSNVGNKAKLGSTKYENDEFFGSLDNVGFVLSLKQGDYTPVRYVNFGFNYRKLKSFDRNSVSGGMLNGSQTEQFAQMMYDNADAYGGMLKPDYMETDGIYNDVEVPWLAPLAYQSYLINPRSGDNYAPYYDDHQVNSQYSSKERGAIHSYDFNFALNLYDRFYIGATLGAYSVDYRRSSSYYEQFLIQGEDYGNYALNNNLEIDGSGVDFKLGVIFRPIESSPLRVGMAISTPTFYKLSTYQSTSLNYDTFDEANETFVKGTATPYDEYSDGNYPSITDFKLTTPWKYNLSLGYTIGSNVALGAEYEYQDYSSAKLKYDDGLKMDYENGMIKNSLRGVHALRLGAEFKVAPGFSLRAGYNHITSSIYSDSYKRLPVNSVRTDTDFANGKAINNYTFGFGYRGETFYADMAYQYHTYEEDFYAFYHEDHITPTKITNDKHQLLFTVGMRF